MCARAISGGSIVLNRIDAPRKLFETLRNYYTGSIVTRTYDVAPDGKRFLMIKTGDDDSARSDLALVLHWGEEVKRLTGVR